MQSYSSQGNPVIANSKTRLWNSAVAVTLPPGALEVIIVNLAASADSTIQIGSLASDTMKATQTYHFRSFTNYDDMRVETSQQIIATPATEELIQIFVMYPSNSTVNLSIL